MSTGDKMVWFTWSGPAKAVRVVGSVTSWPALPGMIRYRTVAEQNEIALLTSPLFSSGGDFVVAFKLPPGVYSYVFEVDGQLKNDPNSPMVRIQTAWLSCIA